MDDIRVLVFCIVHHALCPPICELRSQVVAPSSRFMPRRMVFLPNLPLMLSIGLQPMVICRAHNLILPLRNPFYRYWLCFYFLS